MEHVVFFPAHDGTPAFRRVATLEDAVRLVEHLRNVENVAELSVHALSEVPLAFKTYFRVEVPADGEAAPEAVPAVAPVAEAVVADVVADVVVPAQAEMPPPLPVVDVPPVEAPDAEAPVPAMAGPAEDAPSSLGFFAS